MAEQVAQIEMEIFNKELKNSYRFKAVGDGHPITDVYIAKRAFNGEGAPQRITVTIEK